MRIRKKRAKFIPGAKPGSVLDVKGSAAPRIWVTAYNTDNIFEAELASLESLAELQEKWQVVWIEIQGLGDRAKLKLIAQSAKIPDLTLEDVANQNQRPKLEVLNDMMYIVAPGPSMDKVTFQAQQLDVFIDKNVVITFIETDQQWFSPLKERIRQNASPSRLRQSGAGYLLYAILDVVVDHYIPLLNEVADRLYDLEQKIFETHSYEILAGINRERRNLFEIQRVLKPLGECVDQLMKKEETTMEVPASFYRDLQDHLRIAIDAVGARREIARSLIDMTMSISNHRMSETMKVLTVIATIFIPLSFLAGVFGMNFDTEVSPFNMPELRWKFGYPAALILMLTTAAGLVLYFRKKKWFQNQ